MTARSLLAAGWQVCRLLFALGAGLFFGYEFMTGAHTIHWMTAAACLVAFLGGVLNLASVILNRGKMPVRTSEVPERYKHSHEPVHQKTHVPHLGDWISIGARYYSPGDICIYIGLTILVGDQLVLSLIQRLSE